MFGSVAKTNMANKMGIKREDMVVVSIMPCLAKKYECQREEFSVDGNPDVDYALSTRELAQLIKMANIDFRNLPDEDFDHPMGESTGAGVIFGVTGGVIEAATRTAYEVFTGKKLEKVDFTELRGWKESVPQTVDFNGTPIHIGIAHTLGNARKLLDGIKKGMYNFHAIEIMACPGGCIGGAGQPLHRGNSSFIKAVWKLFIKKTPRNPFANHMRIPRSLPCTKIFLASRSAKNHIICYIPLFRSPEKITLNS